MPCEQYYLEKIPSDASPELRARLVAEAKYKATRDVFGEGFQRARHGRPIEQGWGGEGRPGCQQDLAAYIKWHPNDPDFMAVVARKQKAVDEYLAKQAKAQAAAGDV